MIKQYFLVCLMAITLSSTAQDTARADAKLMAATVYYGYGAELTHQAKLAVNSNTKEIVINQLSTNIDVNSLQISVPEQVSLLSQRFSVFYPEVVILKNPLEKKLQDTAAMILKELKRNQNLIDIEEQTLEKTGKLIEITITTSGNKTVSADDALKLIAAYTAKIEKSKALIFKYKEDRDGINDRYNDLQERIRNLNPPAPKPAKPYGQLILQVVCRGSEDIPVELSYYTTNAGWTPLYDIRVNSKNNDIKLVYKANVTQSTGIDWKQTKLTLSTSVPSRGSNAPLLTPWYLQYYSPALYNQLQGRVNSMAMNSIQSVATDEKALSEVIVQGYAVKKKNLADGYTTVDPSTLQQHLQLNESQLNTNFEINLPYSIESDGRIHSVSIKDEKIIATLKNYAVPKLDRDAYLLAEVADWEKLDLLPGEANIIMDDTYLGKSNIDPNSTADTLNLSLGKDRRLAVKRSAIKEFTSSKTNGSTTKQTFTYELVVKNNKSTEVDMILKDQYPISTIKEVEVKLESNGDAMVNDELGVLTWKLNLKPGESKKVRFTYSVKYPKEQKIAGL